MGVLASKKWFWSQLLPSFPSFTMTGTSIRSKLVQTAGVMPSEDWLTACQTHLRLTNEETADAVLLQILHTDLRDVVRPLATNSTPTNLNPTSPPMILRNLLQQSMRGEARKETLPTNFRLLVQVEELLDVSLNAEARYNIGPASATAPTPGGNQRSRLLKLYLSDGHLPPIHLIGMETVPIPNLSVHSLAGIKVLIQGAIQIRHGLLQLNPQNTTVLGGSVTDLVVIQRKALDQAKRLAGVGVDPTVKALCWNADDALNPEEDEGELASDDVVSHRPNQLPPQRVGLPIVPPQAKQQNQVVLQQRQSSLQSAIPPSQRQVPPAPPYQSHAPSRPEVASQHAAISLSRNNPYMRIKTNHVPSASTIPTPIRSLVENASSSVMPTSQHVRTDTNHATHVSVIPTPTISSRMGNENASVTPISHRIPKTISHPTDVSATNAPMNSTIEFTRASVLSTPCQAAIERKENRSDNLPSLSATIACSTQCTSISAQSSQESAGALRVPLSFDELTRLIRRIVQDRQLYEQYQDKVFVVPLKMKGRHVYFNIEKKKKRRKKEDKYEYVMTSHFTGTGQQQLLTVVVSDDILRPHFRLAPADMRQLSRDDRKASQKLVDEGGASVIAELGTLKSWEVCLCSRADEFFAKPVVALDQGQPILRVLKQGDS
jgi:hypothetical protein